MRVALLLSPDEDLQREARRLWDGLSRPPTLLGFHTADELGDALSSLGEVELVLLDLTAPSPGRIVGAPVIGILPAGKNKPASLPCLERPLRATELESMRDLLEGSGDARPDLAGARERALTRFISGVAHDINNRLATLTGYISMLPEIVSGEDEMIEDMEIAADGAADLVRRWQMFKDLERMPPRPMDLAETLAELAGLLPRLVHPDARLRRDLPARDLWIHGDPGSVEFLIVGILGWFAGEEADVTLTAVATSATVDLVFSREHALTFLEDPDWQRDLPVFEHLLHSLDAEWTVETDALRLHFQAARP